MDTPLRVLIVEDRVSDVEFLVARLERAGIEVESQCVETEDAYREALRTAPDIVISDWLLPRFSGLRALAIHQETGAACPFIVHSGSIGEEAAVEALRLGATDYVLKERPERLATAVRRAVNEYQQASRQRAAAERIALQAAALAAAANGIVITGADGIIQWVNPAFTAATGYAASEAIGRDLRDLVRSGEHSPEFFARFWATILRGEVWRGEIVNRRKDGSRYTEAQTVTPVLDQTGCVTHFVAVKEDVSERKRLEAELAQHRDHLVDLVEERTQELVEAREQAEAANSAKSAFLATMSHEIRTPLNGVIAMAELLALRPLAPDDLDAARTIERSANNLMGVLNDILDFSKIDAGKLELEVAEMSLRDTADDVLAALRPVASASGVDLTVEVDPGVPPVVRGDATRVRQVLMNLAGNAIKFSRGREDVRGEVTVRIAPVHEPPFGIALCVSDNGIGMAPGTLDRLFSSFTQAETSTTRRYGGTGLGLAISRRLVELMGGTIDVSSATGRGSIFTVTLPFETAETQRTSEANRGVRATMAPVIPQAPPPSVAEARARGRLILVAEDDRTNQKVILRQLATLGYTGVLARDGVEAMQQWRSGTFSLLLSDLHMPNMDGYELAAAIRREEAPGVRLPIIALTANALKGEAERASAMGMDAYVTKPVPLAVLRDVLSRWCTPGAQASDPRAPGT